MTNQQKQAEAYLKCLEMQDDHLDSEILLNRARSALAQSLGVHEMSIVNALDGVSTIAMSTNSFLRKVAECEKLRHLNEWIRD